MRGVGNGLVLIVLSGILPGLAHATAVIVGFSWERVTFVATVLAMIVVTFFIVATTGARRHAEAGSAREGVPGSDGAGVAAPLYVFLFAGSGRPLIAAVLMVFFTVFWGRGARVGNAGATKQDLLDLFAGGRADDAHPAKQRRPDAEPGAARSLATTVLRLGAVGGLHLAAAAAAMDIVLALAGLPFPFAGSLLLIVVIGVLDTMASLRAVLKSPASGP